MQGAIDVFQSMRMCFKRRVVCVCGGGGRAWVLGCCRALSRTEPESVASPTPDNRTQYDIDSMTLRKVHCQALRAPLQSHQPIAEGKWHVRLQANSCCMHASCQASRSGSMMSKLALPPRATSRRACAACTTASNTCASGSASAGARVRHVTSLVAMPPHRRPRHYHGQMIIAMHS